MRLPKSYYNNLSLAGTILSDISLLLILFSVILTFVFDANSSYRGLFSYILLPGIMTLGLLLIPIGMLRTIRKAKKKITACHLSSLPKFMLSLAEANTPTLLVKH